MQRYTALLAILVLALFAGSAFAQTNSGTSVAGVRGSQIVLRAADGTETAIPLPENSTVQSLDWNADGSQLVAIIYDQTYQTHLWTVDAQGANPVMLETGALEAGFPAIFAPDGSIIYAQQGSVENLQSPADYQATIMQIAPQAGAQPQTVGIIPFIVGCGGGSPLPGDWLYWQEFGFGGSYVTLQWTNSGILHSLSCGGDGLGLLDPATGQDRVVVPAAGNNMPQAYTTRAKLSPDGQTIAAIKSVYENDAITSSLVLVDLASGTVTEMVPAQEPQQIAWANDGTLYYSSRIETGDIFSSLTPEQQQVFDTATGGLGMPLSAWQVSINKFDPATNLEQTVYTGDAYQVGRMAVSADGSLWFSLVPNQAAWVNAIVSGQLDPVTSSMNDVFAVLPVAVYRLDPTSGAAELASDNLTEFVLPQ